MGLVSGLAVIGLMTSEIKEKLLRLEGAKANKYHNRFILLKRYRIRIVAGDRRDRKFWFSKARHRKMTYLSVPIDR